MRDFEQASAYMNLSFCLYERESAVELGQTFRGQALDSDPCLNWSPSYCLCDLGQSVTLLILSFIISKLRVITHRGLPGQWKGAENTENTDLRNQRGFFFYFSRAQTGCGITLINYRHSFKYIIVFISCYYSGKLYFYILFYRWKNRGVVFSPTPSTWPPWLLHWLLNSKAMSDASSIKKNKNS